MIHKRCDREIEHLKGLLSEANERIVNLENQLVLMVDKPIVPVGPVKPGDVYYMDDRRIVALEDDGDAPS